MVTHRTTKISQLLRAVVCLAVSLFVICQMFNCSTMAEENDDEAGIDVIFIMDRSGSMQTSDPEAVSLASMSLFTDLLSDSSSRVGYVFFNTDVVQTMPLTPVGTAQAQIRNTIASVPTPQSGEYTNMPTGLDSALSLFNQSTSLNRQIAILFTDGDIEMPPSSGLTDSQGEDRCREIAESFKAAGIPLHTVGLQTSGARFNREFIQELTNISWSSGTAARSEVVSSNWDIPEVFAKIYISIFNGNADVGLTFDSQEELRTATFRADEGIYELNILLIHSGALNNITICNPEGETYQDASFQQRDGYSFVKIRYPSVGNWEFTFQGDYISANKIIRYTGIHRNVTVSFNTNSDDTIGAVQVQIGRTLRDAPMPRKEGYRFVAWYTNEALTQPLAGSHTFSKDTLLFAKWEPARIVQFRLVYGEGVDDVVLDVYEGDMASHKMPPERRINLRQFEGWYLDSEFSIPFDLSTIFEEPITIFAKHNEIKVNLAPVIIFFILWIAVTVFAFMRDKFVKLKENVANKIVLALSAGTNLFAVLVALSFFQQWVVPAELRGVEPVRESVLGLVYSDVYTTFFLITGAALPFILNLLLATFLPVKCIHPKLSAKNRQYLVHFGINLIGLVFPLFLGLAFGLGTRVTIFLVVTYLVAYLINFFVSALVYRTGIGTWHTTFFFK